MPVGSEVWLLSARLQAPRERLDLPALPPLGSIERTPSALPLASL
jgi:hypothetical protein